MISAQLESKRRGYHYCIMVNLTQKGKCITFERDNDTDRLQKSVYIHTFVFTSTYPSPFCHNPVESRPILLDSSSIPLDSSRFLWNPQESSRMDAFLKESSVGHQKVQSFSCHIVFSDVAPRMQVSQREQMARTYCAC